MAETDDASSVVSDSSSSQDSDEYQCRPGLCVFINNMEFDDPRLSNLPSGKKDEECIKFIFSSLGFNVQVRQNLTATRIKSTVKKYSKKKHKGAFFLIISSHGGDDDVVYGTDGGEVKVRDLQRYFHATKCPSLVGKPKVFMIDACRGNEDEPVYSITSKSRSQSFGTCYTIHVMDSADIMTIFASTRGNTAGCDEKKGSYLIQTFLKVLIKTTKDKNLTDIMKKVQRKINRTQTPESNFTFSRSYYIKSDTELNALLELEKELQEVVKGWLRLREQTIKQIRELAEMLQEHHRIINKFQIIGFVICSIGVFFILIGSAIDFGITPFTFGINVACIGIAITVGVPFFYSYVIENMKIEKAQKKYSEDHRQLKNLQETIKKMENIVENVYKSNTQIWQIKQNADNFVSTMKLLYPNSTKGSLCRIITQLAMAESLEVGTSALRNGGLKAALALGKIVILLPISLIQSSSNSISVSMTITINKLQELASELEDQMGKVERNIKKK